MGSHFWADTPVVVVQAVLCLNCGSDSRKVIDSRKPESVRVQKCICLRCGQHYRAQLADDLDAFLRQKNYM